MSWSIGAVGSAKNVIVYGKSSLWKMVCADDVLQILLPAILLHGLFDFVLMLIGVLQYIYGIEGIALEIASLVIALCLTIGGALYAYLSFQKVTPSPLLTRLMSPPPLLSLKVQDGFVSGWQTFEDEESVNENERL
jgi:hypothetical protein